MGMSTHVVGIIPPDDVWKKMKAAYDSCVAAGVSIPGEVDQFFNGETPDPAGVVVELGAPCVEKWSDDSRSGFEVDVTKLPPHVRIVRFYNSW